MYLANTWCVTPRLIVRWKDTEMTATNKLLVVKSKQWIRGTEKLRMKYNLNMHAVITLAC